MGSFITPFDGQSPHIDPSAFVDVSARIIGKARVEERVSIWPGAVLRADEEEIIVGAGSAVLDLCLIESPHDHPVIIEPGALISHQACVHGATVKTGALVGIGAIVLDGAVVGEGTLVGAGALVPPGMEVPPGMLMLGAPAKPIRELKPAETANIQSQLKELEDKSRVYMSQG